MKELMKAFVINKYGKNSKGHMTHISEPEVGQNDVLVQVHAASLNPLDFKIRNGEFKIILPYKTPLLLGHDVAGVIVKVGSSVQHFKVGDEIYSRPRDHSIGSFAECIAIHEDDVALKPKNITMEEAASIPLVGLTAWQVLVEKARLKKGQKVFIQAGSGGVGTFAIQLAKHLGATVATTTSSANSDFVKNLGADVVIDYKNEKFETILSDYDVVLNSQDAKSLEKSLSILKQGGNVLSISGPPTPEFAEALGSPWFVKLVTYVLSRSIKRKAKQLDVGFDFVFMRANGKQLSEITALIEAGIIRPIVHKIFAFDEINEAMAYVEEGHVQGKIVIKIKGK
jgi:NADPH:quinone reductase-like Zn-dependent oxidoreductase